MHEMEQMLLKAEDINWTVVRPPGLRNLPSSGRSGNSSRLLVCHKREKKTTQISVAGGHHMNNQKNIFVIKNIPCNKDNMVPK